jgi:hypothetical protein
MWNNNKVVLEKEHAKTKSLYEDTLRLADLVRPNANFDINEVDDLIAAILNPSTFDTATGVMDEINNSGHLDLIKNKDLKDQISNWSRIYEDAVIALNYALNILAPY